MRTLLSRGGGAATDETPTRDPASNRLDWATLVSRFDKIADATKEFLDAAPPSDPLNFRGTRLLNKLTLIDLADFSEESIDSLGKSSTDARSGATRVNNRIFICQYNPERVVEHIKPEYSVPEAAITSSFSQGLIYKWNRPTNLSFEILLNDWGSEVYSSMGFRNVNSSISWLRSKARGIKPSPAGGKPKTKTWNPVDLANRWKPPVLMVLWGGQSVNGRLVGVIRTLTIKHMKWSPQGLIPIRATASLSIDEQVFFPGVTSASFGKDQYTVAYRYSRPLTTESTEATETGGGT